MSTSIYLSTLTGAHPDNKPVKPITNGIELTFFVDALSACPDNGTDQNNSRTEFGQVPQTQRGQPAALPRVFHCQDDVGHFKRGMSISAYTVKAMHAM